jgi:hypothetical protein
MESVERAKQLGATILGDKFAGKYDAAEVRREAQEMKEYTPETYHKFKVQITHLIQVQAKRLMEEAQKLNLPVKMDYLNMLVATALLTGCYSAVGKGILGLQNCFRYNRFDNARVKELGQWVGHMGFLEGTQPQIQSQEKPRDAISHIPEKVNTIQDRFTISKKLGAGSFGAVYLAQDKITKQTVALKQLYPGFQLRDMQEEIDLLNYIQQQYPQHTCPPFLACYLGFFVDKKDQYYLTMEYAPGINLRDYLRQAVRFMETQPKYAKAVVQQIKFVLKQILQHLAVLNELGITQLDFNEGNVLVRRDAKGMPHVTLIDYGALCSNTHDRVCTTRMPCTYCAPEQILPRQTRSQEAKNLLNIQKTPVFALGALLYDVLQGSDLWSVNPRTERDKAVKLISTGLLYGQEAYSWRAPKFSWPYDAQITDMVNAMLIADPQKRPSAAVLARLLS